MTQPQWKVENQFAWHPVLIRNRTATFGIIRLVQPQWVWLRRYTRIYRWSESLERYRTYETVLGWHAKQIKMGEHWQEMEREVNP